MPIEFIRDGVGYVEGLEIAKFGVNVFDERERLGNSQLETMKNRLNSALNRRRFLGLVGGSVITQFAAIDGVQATSQVPSRVAGGNEIQRANRNKRPNVLWIQTDEHRTDSLGCYGSKWAKTPNIDALAARGVVMQTCVCQSPVCVPSRSSQLTVRYPQECNVPFVENQRVPNTFPEDTITFPEHFSRHGYETVSFGKSHTPPHPTWQTKHTENIISAEYAGFFNLADGYDEDKARVVKRPGIHRIIIGGSYPTFFGNPSRRLTDQVIEYLRDRNSDRPFLLRISHNWPHTPVLPPPPFDRLYDPAEIVIQPYSEKAYRERAEYDRTMSDAQRMAEIPENLYRQTWADYMGLVGYVDYEIGRLLAAMKALGLDDDTIVLFSSDHGRALGEYGHGEKCTFDNQVWKVPFIFHWPGRLPEGEVREDLCELVDTGKTLAALAGIGDDVPSNWRGRDLFGGGILPREEQSVFGQIGSPNENAPILQNEIVKNELKSVTKRLLNGIEPHMVNPAFRLMRTGVRTHEYRMDVSWMRKGRRIQIEEADGNLFHLVSDPREMNNLWAEPSRQDVVRNLYARLKSWFENMEKPTGVFGGS